MKTYVKPEIYFESFELSQHIAACSWQLALNDTSSCTATGNGGFIAFVDGNNNCESDINSGTYCYTGPFNDLGSTHQS